MSGVPIKMWPHVRGMVFFIQIDILDHLKFIFGGDSLFVTMEGEEVVKM